MPDPAVHVEGVVKRFRTTTALAGVDLDVEEATVFGLLGPNGAGKTTLIRVLATLLAPDAGRAEVFGRDVVHDEQLGSLNATRMVLTEVIAPVSRIAKDARRDPPGVSRTFSPTRISRPAGRTADARPPPEGSRCRPEGRQEAQGVPSPCAVGGDVVGARYGFGGWPMT